MSDDSLRLRQHEVNGSHSPGHKPGSVPARDGITKQNKAQAIHANVEEEDSSSAEVLKQLAISRGGLVSNALRKKAWPKLLYLQIDDLLPCPGRDVLHGHRDYNQVVLDVNRSVKRFPPGMEEVERLSYQDQLIDTIMRVLVHQPHLHYYQGYHDIVVTFLLVVGEDLTFALMNELSSRHLREFMYATMDQTNYMLNYLYPIICRADANLGEFMIQAEVGTIFCLPWLITWYGHVLPDFCHIVRLYDFFIACHPLMPIYLAAAIVLHRAEEIAACPPEMPIIHSLLSRLPSDLPIENLIIRAGDLFVLHPPKQLEEDADKYHRREQELVNNRRLEAEQFKLARQKRKTVPRRYHLSLWTFTAAAAIAGLAVWTVWYWKEQTTIAY